MAESFRIGIVGAGAVSDGYHAPVLAQFPGVEVAWVCDKDSEKARRFAARHRIARSSPALDSLPDVHAALVAIPVGLRRETIETAVRRHWNLLIEKPFAAALAEHDAILASCRQAKIQVGVGLMRRFFRPVLAGRELVRSGVFGPLEEVWAAEGAPMRGSGRDGDWYQNDPAAAGGGVLIETGSHLVDQALFIAGVEEVELKRAELVSHEGIDFEARLALEARGIKLHIALSRLKDLCNGVVLRFARGTVKVPLTCDGTLELLDADFRRVASLDVPLRGAAAIYQAFYLEWEAFIGQCRSGAPSLIDAASCRLATRLIGETYAREREKAPS